MLRRQSPPISALLLILMVIFCIPVAQAATFTVTNLNDSGTGSLRQAVLDANAALGPDTIGFKKGVWGTITLTTGLIAITDALTINGPGATALAISGNNASGIFHAPVAMTGKVLTINQLTLRNGKPSGSGSGSGGAIYSQGSLLTVNYCILSKNSTGYGSSGGAIYAAGGTVTVNNSTVSGNSSGACGGGIMDLRALVAVNNSTVSYNSATNGGVGGGIFHPFSTGNSITVNNSTIFGNSADKGGGIYAGNGCGVSGGLEGQRLSVNNSTVSGNSATTGGGIYFSNGVNSVTGTIANSIVAGNIAPTGKEIYRDSTAGLLTSGYNLFGENGESGLVEVTPLDSDWVLPGAIDTALGPLVYNGGSTKTLLPVAGSLAINHGSNTLIPAGLNTDQRGSDFLRIVNTTVDIGSVEAGSPFVTYRLTVDKKGGNGGVASLSGDFNCGPICADNFSKGAIVNLTATPDAGYQFNGWSGDCVGTALTCPLTMSATRTVTALFSTIVNYPLTVAKSGNGAGTVTGDGIACGADCTQRYPGGATVTLTAKPAAGSSLYEWIGCDSVNAALQQCTVTMAKARTVKAIFAKPALLTVKKAGLGTVVSLPLGIACGTDCTQVYPYKTIVYLLPFADIGSTFSAWTSCPQIISYAGAKVCAATMTQARTVTATFKKP